MNSIDAPRDRFAQYFKGRGGILDPASLESKLLRGQLEFLREKWATRIVQAQVPSVYQDYTADFRLNAVAVNDFGYDFIGVNIGSIINLRLLFNALMSHPRVLAGIGDTDAESPQFNDLAAVRWANPLIHDLVSGAPVTEILRACPRADSRAQQAFALWRTSVDFLFHHELAHIVCGHLDFLKSEYGLSAIDEIELHAGRAPHVLRALETEADSNGVRMITLCKHNPDVALSAGDHENLVNALLAEFFSLAMLFTVMDQGRRASRDYQDRSHPHPSVRLASVLMAAKYYAAENRTMLRAVNDALPRLRHEIVIVKSLLKLPSAIWREADDPGAFMSACNLETESWQELSSQLKPYRRGIAAD